MKKTDKLNAALERLLETTLEDAKKPGIDFNPDFIGTPPSPPDDDDDDDGGDDGNPDLGGFCCAKTTCTDGNWTPVACARSGSFQAAGPCRQGFNPPSTITPSDCNVQNMQKLIHACRGLHGEGSNFCSVTAAQWITAEEAKLLGKDNGTEAGECGSTCNIVFGHRWPEPHDDNPWGYVSCCNKGECKSVGEIPGNLHHRGDVTPAECLSGGGTLVAGKCQWCGWVDPMFRDDNPLEWWCDDGVVCDPADTLSDPAPG